MPDAPTAPEINATQVLTQMEHKMSTPVFTSDTTGAKDIQKGIEEAQRALELSEKDPDKLRESLVGFQIAPEYTQADFEASAAALNLPSDLKKELMNITKYLEAARTARLTGRSVAEVLGGDAADTQSEVADILIKRGNLKEKFPALTEAYDKDTDLKSFIEELLARDPRFQKRMVDKLIKISEDIKTQLKTTTETEEIKKLRIDKDVFEGRIPAQIEAIKNTLKGIGLTEEEDIEELLKEVKSGVPIKSMLLKAEGMLVKVNGIQERYTDLKDYTIKVSEVDTISAAIKGKKEELGRLGTGKGRDNQRADMLLKDIADLETQLPRAQGRADATRDSLVSQNYTQQQFEEDLRKFNKIKGATDENSALTSYINDYRENAEKVSELNSKIKNMEPEKTPEEKAQEEKNKRELTRRLETAVGEAIAELLADKYDAYKNNQDLLIRAAIKDAEKHNKEFKAGALKRVKQEKESWSIFKNGKFVRNPDAVVARLRQAAEISANGGDAKREILGEITGVSLTLDGMRDRMVAEKFPGKKYSELNPVDRQNIDDGVEARRESHLKDTVASELPPSLKANTYDALSPEGKAAADKIIEQRTQEFNEILSEQGDSFMAGLFVEYSASIGLWDKLGRGKLSLTKDEISQLNRVYSSLMDKEISQSSIGKLLREKALPDSKKKWLLYIAILLGLGIAAVGVAPTAAAVGAAAKGIGTTAWN